MLRRLRAGWVLHEARIEISLRATLRLLALHKAVHALQNRMALRVAFGVLSRLARHILGLVAIVIPAIYIGPESDQERNQIDPPCRRRVVQCRVPAKDEGQEPRIPPCVHQGGGLPVILRILGVDVGIRAEVGRDRGLVVIGCHFALALADFAGDVLLSANVLQELLSGGARLAGADILRTRGGGRALAWESRSARQAQGKHPEDNCVYTLPQYATTPRGDSAM